MRPHCSHKHPRWLYGVDMVLMDHQLHIWHHTDPYWSYRLSALQAMFMMKHMKRAREHTYRSQRTVGGSTGWGSSRAIDSRIERGVGISTSGVSTHIRHVQSQLRTVRCVRVGAALY